MYGPAHVPALGGHAGPPYDFRSSRERPGLKARPYVPLVKKNKVVQGRIASAK
jgi:hypothetical protein